MARLVDDFRQGIGPGRQRQMTGAGRWTLSGDGLRLLNDGATSTRYTNAQIDDYQHLPRRAFPWRPPLRLSVRARFSHPAMALRGTAGFGFWNDPLAMAGRRLPALPQAVWFLYAAPPSDLKLAMDAPGWGWKAATIDARRWPFAALAPTIPLAVPLMNIPPVYRLLWPIGRRAIGVAERLVPVAMTDWHIYTIDWRREGAAFYVDGALLLRTNTAPAGPLGLVIWLDNQYMQVTPWGRFAWGLVEKPQAEWLEVAWLCID